MSSETVLLLLPEMLLVGVATAIYLAGAFFPRGRLVWAALAAAALVAAGWSLVGSSAEIRTSGPLIVDPLGTFVRFLTLAVGGFFVLLATQVRWQSSEYLGSLLLALAGVMLVSQAGDLVLLFVGLELVSIPTYVLLYLGRHDAQSQEATAKYFFLSVLSSAVLLYGLSFLYGQLGTTSLLVTKHTAESAAPLVGPMQILALVLVFAGLGFKIGIAPFHFYAPDVYQGTSHGNAALLSILPKVAGLVALVRLVSLGMPGLEPTAWRIALILAVATMTVGNVLALWQENLRRMLAYSSIAHAGYMLIGLAVAFALPGSGDTALRAEGLAAVLLYLAVYAFATIGAFAALSRLGRDENEVTRVDQLAGLARSQPLVAVALAVCLFSLAGIPPLAGFWGKFGLFQGAISVAAASGATSSLGLWFLGLAIVGVLNAAIAAAYYLRVIGALYFRPVLGTPAVDGGRGAWLAMAASAVLVVAVGIAAGPLSTWANRAAAGTFARPTGVAAQNQTAALP